MKTYIEFAVHRQRPRQQHMMGMTLVELMIAMTISLVLLGAVAAIFVSTSKARNEIERSSRQIENGRYAAEILSDDLRVAGFYGEVDFNTVSLTGPAALPDPCDAAVPYRINRTTEGGVLEYPMHLQGYAASSGGLGCLPATYKTGTDVIVVRRMQTCLAGIDGCEAVAATRPYLHVSNCNELPTPAPYIMALGAVAPTLKQKDCTTISPRRRYLVNIYFISTDNGAGVSIPTLKRMELTGAGFTETPLVEGVEQLHFEYGLDTNDDGAPDSYTSDPATVAGWKNVVTVHFFVLARNIEESPGYKDTKTYKLGSLAVSAPNDGYRRHVYSGLVRIANPAGRRDTP